MGAYDPNPGKDDLTSAQRAPPTVESVPSLSRAPGVRNMVERFDDLSIRDMREGQRNDDDTSSDNLFQVMKAVEDAEATIKQQLEENNKLKEDLIRKTQELERVRLEASMRSNVVNTEPNNPAENRPTPDPTLQPSLAARQTTIDGDELSVQSGSGRVNNGGSKRHFRENTATDNGPQSRISTPSSRSLSPTRQRKEGDSDPRFNPSTQGLMPVSEGNSNLMWKQELIAKIRELEEEIAQLRKHLSDYSMKEAQILNEKYVLEKRIAYMRRVIVSPFLFLMSNNRIWSMLLQRHYHIDKILSRKIFV